MGRRLRVYALCATAGLAWAALLTLDITFTAMDEKIYTLPFRGLVMAFLTAVTAVLASVVTALWLDRHLALVVAKVDRVTARVGQVEAALGRVGDWADRLEDLVRRPVVVYSRPARVIDEDDGPTAEIPRIPQPRSLPARCAVGRAPVVASMPAAGIDPEAVATVRRLSRRLVDDDEP